MAPVVVSVRPRLDREKVVIAVFLAAGIAFRLAIALPAHQYPADADMAVNALCAFEVLRGEAPIFAVAERLGSAGCHVTAVLFLILGPTRTALAAGPAIVGCLTLLAWYLFLRELLGARISLWALPFVAIPSPAFTLWSYLPNSYPETLFACSLTLWLTARLGRGDQRWLTFFGLGLAVGFGWWNSMQTVGCTLPALLWLAWRRPRLLRRPLFVPLVLAGLLLGAGPWLIHNVRQPLGSFRGNFATRAAAGPGAKVENVRYLLTYSLPELVAGAGQPVEVSPRIQGLLRPPALFIWTAAALYFFSAPVIRRVRRLPASAASLRAPPWLLFLLVIATLLALNVLSEAGQRRGLTVRYILPLYLVAPGQLAFLLARLGARRRILAGSLAAIVLALNLAGAALPGTATRRERAERARDDARLTASLSRLGVDAVLGNFWHVYPLNFLSREEILGVPLEATYDLADVTARLPNSGVRWALLDPRKAPLTLCAERTGLVGRIERLTRHHWVLVEEPAGPEAASRDLLERVRAACFDRVNKRWLLRPTAPDAPSSDDPAIFSGGFESGDASEWSAVFP